MYFLFELSYGEFLYITFIFITNLILQHHDNGINQSQMSPQVLTCHFCIIHSELIVMTRLIRALLTILMYDYMVLSNAYLFSVCPEQDSNLGLCRIAVLEDCKATALTTPPPRLDNKSMNSLRIFSGIFYDLLGLGLKLLCNPTFICFPDIDFFAYPLRAKRVRR